MLASGAVDLVLIGMGETLNNWDGKGGLVYEQSFEFFLLVLTKRSRQEEGRASWLSWI